MTPSLPKQTKGHGAKESQGRNSRFRGLRANCEDGHADARTEPDAHPAVVVLPQGTEAVEIAHIPTVTRVELGIGEDDDFYIIRQQVPVFLL